MNLLQEIKSNPIIALIVTEEEIQRAGRDYARFDAPFGGDLTLIRQYRNQQSREYNNTANMMGIRFAVPGRDDFYGDDFFGVTNKKQS